MERSLVPEPLVVEKAATFKLRVRRSRIEGFFFVSEEFLVLSSLNSIAFDSGNAGNVELVGERASLREGGSISSVSAGAGNSGDVFVRVGHIELTDGPTGRNQFGGLTTATLGNGDAGDLRIVTERLSLEQSNAIDSSTFSRGDAGNIEIVASEAIVVRPGIEPTVISSSALPFELESLRAALGIPPRPEGDSGSVTLIAPRVEVEGGNSRISVRHEGSGDAGNLNVRAQMVRLDRGGRLTAATSSGRGGNITLDSDIVRLSSGSQITTAAGGIGNGGNITLDLDVALILEESDIVADALEGVGGNVQITTPGLFADDRRNSTASSRFGLDGTVQLNVSDLNRATRPIVLQSNPLDATAAIATDVCRLARRNQSRFVNVGRGGIPPVPGSQYSAPVLEDWRILDREELEAADTVSVPLEPEYPTLVEAQGWYVNDAGQIVLTATPPADNFPNHRERGTSDCW
ncbi:MAG: S-layer family protein [Cyanobacteriota bacterium]|nr:S-layer family protein [Cyanobacteriota bacterium]